jgi:hypothetical protein
MRSNICKKGSIKGKTIYKAKDNEKDGKAE